MGTFKAVVDWNNDDFICRWCKRTDTLQSIRTWLSDPLDLTTWRAEPTNGAVVTIDIDQSNDTIGGNPNEERFFGTHYYITTVTGATTDGIKIFALTGGYDITTTINKVYTVAFWITCDLDTSMTYRARLYSNNYATQESSTVGTIDQFEGWERVTLAYTAAASNNLTLEIVNTSGSSKVFYVAGIMVFETAAAITAPEGYNTGAATDIYDDITPDVMSMSWQLGMFKPYQQMADEGVATLTLRNNSSIYTPENTSSPLYGYLNPTLFFEIGHWLGVAQKNYRPMYRGQLDTPPLKLRYQTAGANTGKTEVTLHALTNKMWLDTQDFEYPVAENANIGLTIRALLGTTPFAYGNGAFDYLGFTGERAGTVTNFAPQPDATAWQTIADLVAVEEGKFYIDRGGTINLLSKYYSYDNGAIPYSWGSAGANYTYNAGTIAETGSYKPYRNVEYAYGANYVNRVRVTAHPRTANASGTVWQNSSINYDIPAGETDVMIVRLRDALGRFTSCSSVAISLLTYSSGTATTTVTPQGGKAYINFNNSGTISAVLSSLAITGASASQQNDIAIEIGSAGTATYGIHMASYNLDASGSARQARDIARHILNRDNTFQGYVYSVPFQNGGDGTQNAHQLQWKIGTRVNVDLDSISHNKDYWIIGEKHTVTLDGDVHQTTFALEPTANTSFWRAGVEGYSNAGVSTRAG